MKRVKAKGATVIIYEPTLKDGYADYLDELENGDFQGRFYAGNIL